MTQHESTDVLVSVADDALRAAEADAATPNSKLIFRPEWRPTPRTRGSLAPPVRPPMYVHRVEILVPHPSVGAPPSSVFTPPANSPPPLPASAPVSPSLQAQPNLEDGAVGDLLRENREDYDEVINHAFPRAMGDGTASLDGFRYYMLQDRLYLQMCIGLKMISAAGTHDFDAMKGFEFRHKSSIEYVTSLEETCTTMLGITKSMIDETKRSSAIKTSENYYMTTLRSNNPVLGYYVVLLPCILTYWVIANRLMNDPKTAKNVVYHSAWTEVNNDTSSVYKYIKFINENIAAEGHFDAWSSIFKIACKLEVDMFKTGLRPPAAYKIIDDGIYSINVASGSLVLAIRDVADVLQHPSTKSLADFSPNDTRTCVVGMKEIGGSEEKWQISSTPSGYTIQNIGTGLYIASKEKNNTRRILQATAEPYYWWINPVKERSSRYQIYDTANLRFTLHAEIEAPGSNESNCIMIPVFAAENIQSPSQIWTFDDGVERPTAAETTESLPVEGQTAVVAAHVPAPANTGISAEHLSAELNRLTVQHDREMQALRDDVGRNVENFEVAITAEIEQRASHHDHELAVLKEDTRKSVGAGEMRKIVAGGIESLKAEMLAEMTKLRDQFDSRTSSWDSAKNGQAKDDEHLRTHLPALACHWERLTRRIFHPSDLEAQPIVLGGRGSLARYIMRVQTEDASWVVTAIGDGRECDTRRGDREFWVLVGRASGLTWVSCRGRFRAYSIDEDLVSASDSESVEHPDATYIAMFVHEGDEYITYVKEGQNGVSKRISERRTVSSEDYEVLCYKTAL
ncbi:heme oxygenase-like protein [Favolaschia claudopus]|uniref:Heme oxygenase-like protein n=1 Tax=Favolaschia claudopus TaxID=2862362 RepID=A0AAW0DIX0_9AGAR